MQNAADTAASERLGSLRDVCLMCVYGCVSVSSAQKVGINYFGMRGRSYTRCATSRRCSSPCSHTIAHASAQSLSRNSEGAQRYDFCCANPLRKAAWCTQCYRFSRTQVGHRCDLKVSNNLVHACRKPRMTPSRDYDEQRLGILYSLLKSEYLR